MKHNDQALTPCPGCGVRLTPFDGPTHRYIGASAACWVIFGALVNGGEPPLAPAPHVALLVDGYAVQHPGTPSPQSIQSVAVHLLALYSVYELGMDPADALQVRLRALRDTTRARQDRFSWLEPPELHGGVTMATIAAGSTPAKRTELAAAYLDDVWTRWAAIHPAVVAEWYAAYVVPDRL